MGDASVVRVRRAERNRRGRRSGQILSCRQGRIRFAQSWRPLASGAGEKRGRSVVSQVARLKNCRREGAQRGRVKQGI